MPRLFRGNFDFEHQLANPTLLEMPTKLKLINAKWVERILPLLRPGDFLWLPEWNLFEHDQQRAFLQSIQNEYLRLVTDLDKFPICDEPIEFVPWGWTTNLRQLVLQHGWQAEIPDDAAVRWVNSRATSFQMEQHLDETLTGSALISDLSQLYDSLENYSGTSKWVIKAEFGMSARERILGQGSTVQPQQHNWVARRVEQSGLVVLEPWLERIAETSFHYHISPLGDVRYLGATLLNTDAQGRYLSNTAIQLDADQQENWQKSLSVTEQFAAIAAEQGYFGPLSFDAMRYRDHLGQERERPLQDINGRYTMGRCEWERCSKSIEL